MQSFWTTEKPLFALAPMADVTDPAYRALIADYAKASATAIWYATWTEFVSADGLYHTREKKKMADEENPLVRDLRYTEAERPVIAQFFTGDPAMMEYAAALAVELGFDGVDINMGCPDRSIEKQGAGAASIRNPERSREVIRAALRGAAGKIPVSVKTRLGYNRIEYEEWLPHLLGEDIAGLTMHMRTRKEMSLVPAHYELAGDLVRFVKERRPELPFLANGDLASVKDAKERAIAAGFDGAMLGRAIFGNPWLFAEEAPSPKSKEERVAALLGLARRFDALRPKKHYAILKKHFKAFIRDWPDAGELRARLMETGTLSALEAVLAG